MCTSISFLVQCLLSSLNLVTSFLFAPFLAQVSLLFQNVTCQTWLFSNNLKALSFLKKWTLPSCSGPVWLIVSGQTLSGDSLCQGTAVELIPGIRPRLTVTE